MNKSNINSIEIDLDRMLYENRITIPELSKSIKVPTQTLYSVKRRGTVTIPLLRKLGEKIKDVEKYITAPAIIN